MARLSGFAAICACFLLAACGGGGSGGSAASMRSPTPPTPPAPPTPASNTTAITVDAGPAAVTAGPNGVVEFNMAYVSVTLCAPRTGNCQTIDHVALDTGSVGLRIVQSALNASLLSALPAQSDASGSPVGECFGFVDGFAFGSVRQADFAISGEQVSNMPFQVVADAGVFSNPPASCSSGGGMNLNSVQALGANGILGVGTTTTDCGVACTMPAGSAAATYYDCPASGCGAIIARTAAATAPFQQLPNPVAAMSTDNNGVLISLPAPAVGGQASLSGTLVFGIGTEANNALGSATVLPVTTSSSPLGPGFLTATFNGQALDQSFLDTGTNLYLFIDGAVGQCTGTGFTGFYCPPSPLTLTATLQGVGAATTPVVFTLGNAKTLLSTANSAVPGVGGTPTTFANPIPSSFDFGLPFFYGRNVYVAIEGRTAGGVAGPFVAF